MSKVDLVKLNSVNKENLYTQKRTGNSFKAAGFATTPVNNYYNTQYTPSPKKEISLKHLFNAVPDSYLDEIIAGSIAIAAATYKIIKGKGVSGINASTITAEAQRVVTKATTEIQGKLTQIADSVSDLAKSTGKISTDVTAAAEKATAAQTLAKNAQKAANDAKKNVGSITYVTQTGGPTFVVDRGVDVNLGALKLDLASVMHGYGEKEPALVNTLKTEATKRIFGLFPKKVSTGEAVTIRVPTAEFEGIAKTGGLAVVPPELMANLSAFVNEKQRVRMVLDMPLYLGAYKNGANNSLQRADKSIDILNALIGTNGKDKKVIQAIIEAASQPEYISAAKLATLQGKAANSAELASILVKEAPDAAETILKKVAAVAPAKVEQQRALLRNTYKIVNDVNGEVEIPKLERIAEFDVPIFDDVTKHNEKLEVFIQRGRSYAVDFNLAKNYLSEEANAKISNAITTAHKGEANAPAVFQFGSLRVTIDKTGKPKAELIHDAVFYKSDKFNMAGPKMQGKDKNIYDNNAFASGETERFMYFDKFFYEFMLNQDKVSTEAIATDAILGNDWHTGGIAAMTRLLTKAKEASNEITAKQAEKIYNIPIATLMHNATLGGSTWHSQAKLANVLFGEHSSIIVRNAAMPDGAGTFNGLFTQNAFNPQTMAAAYSDTVIPVSKGYAGEIAEKYEFGGANQMIFNLRQKAAKMSDEYKRGAVRNAVAGTPIEDPANTTYRKLGYDPVTNGLDKVNNVLTSAKIEKFLTKGLNIPSGTIKPYTPDMSLVDWHKNNKKVLLSKLAETINAAKKGTGTDTQKAAGKKIQLLEATDLTGVNEDTMVISTLGRLVDQKGIDIFAGAIENFYSKHPNMTNPPVFYIQGSGDDKYGNAIRALKKHVAEKYGKQAADRIIWTGWFREPEGFTSRLFSDYVAMSSWFEPCGLVHKEFQATGGAIPIVNKTGGLTDGLREGVDSIFSKFTPKKPGDEQQSAQALKENSGYFADAIETAFNTFNDKAKFNKMFEESFNCNHSWLMPGGAAEKYANILIEAGVLKPDILVKATK